MEVLIATHDCKIQLVTPQQHGRAGEGFLAAPLIAEASLLPSKVRMTSGRRPVAMATGYLDPEVRVKPHSSRGHHPCEH